MSSSSSHPRATKDSISFVEAADLRKNDLIILKDRVAKIKELVWSCPGKHGSAKYLIVAYAIDHTQKRIEQSVGAHERVTVPVVWRYDADVLSINGNILSVFDTIQKDTHDRLELDEDNPLHDEIVERVNNGDEVVLDVLAVYGTEKIMSIRKRRNDED
jgi:translation elongation factor P/translation initiation factor 5A